MNIILNLMLFVGFLGFLFGLGYLVIRWRSPQGGRITPTPVVSLILASTLLVIGVITPRSTPAIPLQTVPVNAVQGKDHLKNLLKTSLDYRATPGAAEDMGSVATQSPSGNTFVDTNVQVEGIKEGDVVKTDGDFIYYASRWDSRVRVMSVDQQNQVSYITTIQLATETETIYTDSMYLTDDYLVIIGYRYDLTQSSCAREDDNGDVYYCAEFLWWQPTGSVVLIDRSSYEIVYSLRTDAAFIDHRLVPLKVGNTIIQETLYLVGHYYFNMFSENEELRPSYIENEEAKTYLPYASMSYITEDNLYAMTTFTGIPLLSDPASIQFISKGFLGTTPDYKKLFVNENHLYLAQSNYVWKDPQSYQTTTILKFNLILNNGDLNLKAVGTIRGIAINQFALDEYQGFFRIATTDTVWNFRANEWWWSWENRVITNRLYVLSDLNDGNFGITALIEEGLGKPGESIMSVRFQGPLAYVVTFLRTDPLYIVDLSNPAAPVIREEIVLPGYDTYQHPWGENRLIGLGYDADDTGRLLGMKLSAYRTTAGESQALQTFNISDHILSGMEQQEGEVWGWTWAEALWDHRAITVSVDQGIFAFAINAYSYQAVSQGRDDETKPNDIYYEYTFTYHSLYFIFKIDFTQGQPIQLIEKIEHPSSDIGYVQVDRGVMINQVIHTLSNQQMISYDLTTNTILQTLIFPEYVTI